MAYVEVAEILQEMRWGGVAIVIISMYHWFEKSKYRNSPVTLMGLIMCGAMISGLYNSWVDPRKGVFVILFGMSLILGVRGIHKMGKLYPVEENEIEVQKWETHNIEKLMGRKIVRVQHRHTDLDHLYVITLDDGVSVEVRFERLEGSFEIISA